MSRIKFIMMVSMLLFTSTGIKSKDNKPLNIENVEDTLPKYTFDEFNQLQKEINRQIELNNKLKTLK